MVLGGIEDIPEEGDAIGFGLEEIHVIFPKDAIDEGAAIFLGSHQG